MTFRNEVDYKIVSGLVTRKQDFDSAFFQVSAPVQNDLLYSQRVLKSLCLSFECFICFLFITIPEVIFFGWIDLFTIYSFQMKHTLVTKMFQKPLI